MGYRRQEVLFTAYVVLSACVDQIVELSGRLAARKRRQLAKPPAPAPSAVRAIPNR